MPEDKANRQAEKQETFFLVYMSDDDDTPRCLSFAGEEDFIEAVEQNVLSAQTEVFAFAFKGERVSISAPKPVCVLNIGGKARQIGAATSECDESGKIVPLILPGPALPSDA